MSNQPISSTAKHPDLDWSQIKETVLMLNLATAQVDFSLRDGDNSVNTLTESFTAMAGGIQSIQKTMQGIGEKYQLDEGDHMPIQQECMSISIKMQEAIVAFQFYDKLVQRLDHVVEVIAQLADLVGDNSRLYSPEEWSKLQQMIRSRYTMEEERELFDALMRGEDVKEVMERLQHLMENKVQEDDIELF